MADLLASKDERTSRAVIDAAATLLAGDRNGAPDNLIALLFGRTAPEDLAAYTPSELAALAANAWSFLELRMPGAPKVRFELPDPGSGERLKSIAVIEIVNDDMPFLVDSVMGELTDRGLDIRLVAHPVLAVERNATGMLKGAPQRAGATSNGLRESLIHIHVERVEDAARRAEVVQAVEQVLAEVRLAVEDWRAMRERVGQLVADLRGNPPPLPQGEVEETANFLDWLGDNNFTFLGLRDYDFLADGGGLKPRSESALGLLRQRDMRVDRKSTRLNSSH